MRRAASDVGISRSQPPSFALLGLLLLLTTACGGNQLSACGAMCCNELNFFTLRTESRLSAEQVELVWYLVARPFELEDFWKTEQWPKLTVGVVVPLSLRGHSDLLYQSCFGRGVLRLPGFREDQSFLIRHHYLAVERRGDGVSAGGGLMLEVARDLNQPPPKDPSRLRVNLYLKPAEFEGVEPLSPQGAELIAQVAESCAFANQQGGGQ